MSSTTSIHVIVPCYNPPAGWEESLAGRFSILRQALEPVIPEVGLIVVNDGSSRNAGTGNFDRLSALVPGVRIVSYSTNRGKGYALRQGVEASDSTYQLVTDTDFPYTMESMVQVVRVLQLEGGIAAGNRDTRYYANVPAFRRWLSRFLRWLLRHVLHQPIDDSQCGLKAFDRDGKTIFLETTIDRFLFDLEFLMLANGRINVTPVPVALRDGVVFSPVGWRILATEGRNFLRLFLRKLLN